MVQSYKKIGILGYGNMGSAIGQGIKDKYTVFVFDKDKTKIKDTEGVSLVGSIEELIQKSQAVILAVKPQDFGPVLEKIKEQIGNKLIISIAAGITTKDIESFLGKVKVIRVMPNIGAIVGEAVSYICKGRFAKANDLKIVIKIFNAIGHTFIIDEDLMPAATALGGSGPGFWGYLFDKMPRAEWDKYKLTHFIPELTIAAESIGFDRQKARSMAHSVTSASIATADALHIRPAELTKKVASKGGTTEAGLNELKKGRSLKDAINAAVKKAKALSKKLNFVKSYKYTKH